MEKFIGLPSCLEEWTYETVVSLVQTREFEPGAFDYKSVLNATGNDKQGHIASIRRTACSMANADGGFILFGIKDRKVAVAVLEDRITGIPIAGDLLKEFGSKIEAIQPEIYFEAVPQVLVLPHDTSRGIFIVYIPRSQRRPHMDESEGIYYKRGEHGAAVAMSHSEVREQMMHTEDRMKKITLLRLELMQYKEIALDAQPRMTWVPDRFDVSAFKVLLAEVCSLIPINLLHKALNVPRQATILNRHLDEIHGKHFTDINPGTVNEIRQDIRTFVTLCDDCEHALQEQFGPVGLG